MAPMSVSITPLPHGRAEVQWAADPQIKAYRVEYRVVGNPANAWFGYDSEGSTYTLTGLQENTAYEVRVGTVCDQARTVFSDPTTFTTLMTRKVDLTDCGVRPDIRISNREPMELLRQGDVVMAGDFAVTLLRVQGGHGRFSGIGYVDVPFLGFVRLAVKFDNIEVNTEGQLIGGFFNSIFDVDWEEKDAPTFSEIGNEVKEIGELLFDVVTKLLDKKDKLKELAQDPEKNKEELLGLLEDVFDSEGFVEKIQKSKLPEEKKQDIISKYEDAKKQTRTASTSKDSKDIDNAVKATESLFEVVEGAREEIERAANSGGLWLQDELFSDEMQSIEKEDDGGVRLTITFKSGHRYIVTVYSEDAELLRDGDISFKDKGKSVTARVVFGLSGKDNEIDYSAPKLVYKESMKEDGSVTGSRTKKKHVTYTVEAVPSRLYSIVVDNSSTANTENIKKGFLSEFKNKTGVELAVEDRIYVIDTNGELKQIEKPLSDAQITNGEWSDKEDRRVRYEINSNGVVQMKSFGIRKDLPLLATKKADLPAISKSIQTSTNEFLAKNNVIAFDSKSPNFVDENEVFADGKKIRIGNGSTFVEIIDEGTSVVVGLLKTGEFQQKTYLESTENSSVIHAPGVVTGTTEVVAMKVTDLTSLATGVYTLVTDKQARTDVYNGLKDIKEAIGKDSKAIVPILVDVVTTTATGNTEGEWKELKNSNTDFGRRSHLGTRGVGNSVVTVMAGVAFVKELPEIAEKLGEAIKKGKKIFGSAKELFEDINKNRHKIRKVLDSDVGKEYAKKYFDKVVKNGNFEDWYNNVFKEYKLGEPLNFEVHHVIPVKVLEGNKELQELLLWAEKNGKKFDFNDIENGIPLPKKSLKFEQTGHANHPAYDNLMSQKINDILERSPNQEKAFERIQNLIDNTKKELEREVLLGIKDVNHIMNM